MSGFGLKVRDYLKSRYRSFVAWRENKSYRWRKKYRVYKDYFIDSLYTYGKEYGRFVLFETAPYVLVYGLMINFPLSVLLGWELGLKTVVSWGLVFYFVDEELTSILNELKPYIRVSAKVDK